MKQKKKLNLAYIVDNGAYTIKVGSSQYPQPDIIPNCIMKVKSERRRPFIGDQINECRDASGLFYILPFQKGYLINWDIQKTVWDYIFFKENFKFSEYPIIITEPMFNFSSNQDAMDEIFFEEYDAVGFLKVTAPELAAYHHNKMHNKALDMIVIDTGYSFTHIVPFIDGKKYLSGIKRIDVGGKVLTNHLKEVISYRQLHVMDETYVINQVKEDACFVSDNFRMDMQQTSFKDSRNKIIREYILPDFSTIKRGYLRHFRTEQEKAELQARVQAGKLKPKIFSNGPINAVLANTLSKPQESDSDHERAVIEQQSIVLNNERIAIPEILFHPSDIGISQKGIAEAVVECIKSCPEEAMYPLLANIIVIGGNALFPNFSRRLFSDIRCMFDSNLAINVFTPNNPVSYAWQGGKILSNNPEFSQFVTTKEEYDEYGHTQTRSQTFPFTLKPTT